MEKTHWQDTQNYEGSTGYVLSNVLFTIKAKPFITVSSCWQLKIYIKCGTLLHRTTSTHCQQLL